MSHSVSNLCNFCAPTEPLTIHTMKPGQDPLVPRTTNCAVLRHINHQAMIHAGDLPEFKDDRLAVEKALGKF